MAHDQKIINMKEQKKEEMEVTECRQRTNERDKERRDINSIYKKKMGNGRRCEYSNREERLLLLLVNFNADYRTKKSFWNGAKTW